MLMKLSFFHTDHMLMMLDTTVPRTVARAPRIPSAGKPKCP